MRLGRYGRVDRDSRGSPPGGNAAVPHATQATGVLGPGHGWAVTGAAMVSERRAERSCSQRDGCVIYGCDAGDAGQLTISGRNQLPQVDRPA